jgi:Brp/Blh family beta-carotene 15,15'-monooxygenase
VPQPDLDKPASGLVQRFTGWHIRTEAECFDPSSIDLMDFESSVTSGRTTFFYILPFNEREALIEVTYLDDPRLVPANSEYDLKRKVDELTRGRYQVLYRERASLPMHCLPARPSQEDGVIRIGRLGGRLKPSSGYAFLRIQRQSKAIAQALGSGESLPTDYEAGFYKVLDHIFLETLERRAADASSYFVPLFQQVPPDTLVRFLGESASLAESFSVVMALPKWPFLRAGLRLLTNKQKINTVALPWRVLVFAAVVAGACTTQAHGTNMTPGLFAAVLVGIAIAIWHGAFDGVLARPILEKPLGRWWIPGFATGYLALAVAVALLWWIEPRFILPVFLLYSAWHFGTEVNPGSLSLASSAVALSVGALPIAAACRWHPVQVTAIFARMLHFSHSELFASHIAHGAGEVLWWATLIAVVGTLLGLRGQGWATCLESLVVIGLELALFWFCDPLLAFGVFFCIWHTPEHLLTSAEDANSRFSKRIMWQQLRSGLLPWLLSLIMLGVFLALEPKHLTAYSSALFILLSALTIPHMLLSEMRRGRV